MNLLCPSCQKMLQVPEQYAGQLMKCPLCTSTFTVPALPQAPPTPAMSSPPPAPMHDPLPDLGPAPAPARNVSAPPPPPPPSGYAHTRSFVLSPKVLPWVAPVSLLIVFVLLFFTWVGMYPSGEAVVWQSGWSVAFGGYETDKVWDKYFPDDIAFLKDMPAAVLTVFFLLMLLPTMVLALGTVLIHRKMVPVELPPSMTQYWQFRPLLIAGMTFIAFLFLALQMLSGFPLESRTKEHADKVAKKVDKVTDEDAKHQSMEQGRALGMFNLERKTWLTWTVFFLLLAVVFSLLDFWLEWRGNQAPPRADLHY